MRDLLPVEHTGDYNLESMVEGGIKAGVAQCILALMSEGLSTEAGLGIFHGPIKISD